MRIRYLIAPVALVAAAAIGFIALSGGPIQAANIFNAHVHDDYFHPTGSFVVGPGHSTAQALCMSSTPDPTCTATVNEGDSVNWVAPAPLAVNPHTVTECTDGTWTVCGAGSSAPNPIEDSGVRFQPGWPYLVQFDDPGTFYYRCEIHPTVMRGAVNVIPGVGGTVELLGTGGDPSAASESASDDSTLTYIALAASGAMMVMATGGLILRRKRAARIISDE
jgi:plastocyanin